MPGVPLIGLSRRSSTSLFKGHLHHRNDVVRDVTKVVLGEGASTLVYGADLRFAVFLFFLFCSNLDCSASPCDYKFRLHWFCCRP